MAPSNPSQATAQDITNAVICNDATLPDADQFGPCTTSDIATALHHTANIYTSRAETITDQNATNREEEDDSGANEAIKFILTWWKQIATQDAALMASNGDRDTMIGSLIMCLDSIKDMEWEVL